jgi:hypothetical protein
MNDFYFRNLFTAAQRTKKEEERKQNLLKKFSEVFGLLKGKKRVENVER